MPPELWRSLLTPERKPLLDALRRPVAAGRVSAGLIEQLRNTFPLDHVTAALELVAAQERGRGKFGDTSAMLLDVVGVEQASGRRVADHKAERFHDAPRIADLCCGVGGDTIALARVCDDVVAVDRSPLRAAMAGHNAAVRTEVRDVAGFVPAPDQWIHIDPSRRDARSGRRKWRYADCEPGPEVVEPILCAAPGAAIKLGPGLDVRELPERESREIEFIGDARGLLLAVVWCGAAVERPGWHRATRLVEDGRARSLAAAPEDYVPVASHTERYLLLPDPALERADLVAAAMQETGIAGELAPRLGVLTGSEPPDSPWFTAFELIAELPWRLRKICAWLAAHDGGAVVVRTRDAAVNTDRAQVELRGGGDTVYTVFGLRLGKRIACFVTRPVPAVDPPG